MKGARRTPTLTWATLVSLTALSVFVAEKGWPGTYSSAIIILITTAKSRMVILHYMEARHAPARWRFLYELWNLAAATTFMLGYFMGASVI
ncbi:hypothetical protein PTE30175_05153 [Pandoraea terrae]|uniref:Cytochrome C oxidase subunit IV n=1 Tax=Pandoraea terrae TaxID=1537710 RepID=A0A5E4ZB81_9BURK|nr:cytochrome C oxidase subunit IV family protein [Pandoraea terrae]VVE57937.1 hypothetical protein PTE30175_05153 [Pandoraea terrae]